MSGKAGTAGRFHHEGTKDTKTTKPPHHPRTMLLLGWVGLRVTFVPFVGLW